MVYIWWNTCDLSWASTLDITCRCVSKLILYTEKAFQPRGKDCNLMQFWTNLSPSSAPSCSSFENPSMNLSTYNHLLLHPPCHDSGDLRDWRLSWSTVSFPMCTFLWQCLASSMTLLIVVLGRRCAPAFTFLILSSFRQVTCWCSKYTILHLLTFQSCTNMHFLKALAEASAPDVFDLQFCSYEASHAFSGAIQDWHTANLRKNVFVSLLDWVRLLVFLMGTESILHCWIISEIAFATRLNKRVFTLSSTA